MKDYNWVKNRFGTRMANILRGLRKEVFDISENNDAKFKDTEGKEYSVLTTQALQTKGSEAEQAFSAILANKSLIEVKWAELKDLRDTSKLIPGSLYRITDYQCTTTQENTKSAGHQFDIVLLALSENKLAEEGWAMMNESNIYDVTFNGGVTKKCYIFKTSDADCNVVLLDTMLGYAGLGLGQGDDIEITNEEDKTAVASIPYTDLGEENVQYNYFQNSNLSAWKVWYCLDNDKSRFAWAQGLKIMYKYAPFADAAEVYVSNITRIYNNQTYYSCLGISDDTNYNLYVTDKNINQNTTFYTFAGPGGQEKPYITSSVTIIEEGTGVIYRLIDEWNNDVCYDFKNILFMRPVAGGEYTPTGGTQKFLYTFNATTADNDCSDLTLHNGEEADSNICRCTDNVILPRTNPDGLGYMLNIVTFIVYHDVDDEVVGSCENNTLNDVYDFVGGSSIIGVSIYNSRFIFVYDATYNSIILSAIGTKQTRVPLSGADVIYINDKKVLTET